MSLLPSRPDAEPAEDAGPRVIGLEDEAADEVLSALSSGTARSLLAALHDEPAPPSELAERCGTSLQNVQYHLEKLEGAGAIEVVDTAYSSKGREMDVYAPADQPLVVFAGDEDDGSTLRTAIRRLLGAVGILALASVLIEALARRGGLGFLAPSSGGDGAGGDGGAGDVDDGDTEFQGEEDVGGGDGGGGTGGDAPEDTPTSTETEVTQQATETPAQDGGATATPQADTPVPEATETSATEAPETAIPDTVTEAARETTTGVPGTAADGTGGGADALLSGLPPGLLFFAGGLFVVCVIAVVWYVSER